MFHHELMDIECKLCDKIFTTKDRQMLHIETVHKNFQCETCKQKFTQKSSLKYHLETVNCAEKMTLRKQNCKFDCDICGKGFSFKHNLKNHLQKVHSVKAFAKCDACKEEFNHYRELLKHKKILHPKLKKFACNLCNANYKSRAGKRYHIETAHNEKGTFECDKCGKIFMHKLNLTSHLKRASCAAKKCKSCDQVFDTDKGFSNHACSVHQQREITQSESDRLNQTDESGQMKSLGQLEKEDTNPLRLDLQDDARFCSKSFQTKESVNKLSKQNKNFKCNSCGKGFSFKHNLKNHLQKVHSVKGLAKCDVCEEEFNHYKDLLKHKKMLHPKIEKLGSNVHAKAGNYVCNICDANFKSKTGHRYHIKTLHNTIKNFECKDCGQKFAQTHILDNHLKGDNCISRIRNCDSCDEVFNSKKELVQHRRQFHREKFECGICNAMLATKGSRDIHVEFMHTKIKNFECTTCSMQFYKKPQLQQHVQKVHMGITYDCHICTSKLTNKQSFEYHMKTVHSVAKVYKCDRNGEACEEQFETLRDLIRHRKFHHEKVKIFKCETCDKAYKTGENLRIHIETVHKGLKKYGCDACDEKFTSKQNLQNHLNRVHSLDKQ